MVLIQDNSSVLQIGDPLPAFGVPSVAGLQVESDVIKDPVLAVIFTCNHCPYAKAYNDRLVAMAHHFDGKGVQFIAISSNDASQYPEDSFTEMKNLSKHYAFPFPYCYDESQLVAQSFGVLCTPHCFVFDQNRTLQYKGRIDDNWQDPEQVTDYSLYNAIDSLVKNEPVKQATIHAIGCSIKWK